MFVPEKVMTGYGDLSDSVDVSQKNSFGRIRKSPLGGEPRAGHGAQARIAHGPGKAARPYSYKRQHLGQMRAAAAAACHAASLNSYHREPIVTQSVTLKSYLPGYGKSGLTFKPLATTQGPSYGRGERPAHNADAGGHGNYLNSVKSPPRAPVKRALRKPAHKSHHPTIRSKFSAAQPPKAREVVYTNADLSNIQEQIRQQVEYQKLIQAQSEIKMGTTAGMVGVSKKGDALSSNQGDDQRGTMQAQTQ